MDIYQIKEIKELKPFLVLSKDIETTNVVFSYYLKSFAIQKAHKAYLNLGTKGQNVPELMNSITQWLKDVETQKSRNP